MDQQYFRLELDDYSAAAFTSFGKYYFGTLEEIRSFIEEIDKNKHSDDSHKSLLSAFYTYEAGNTDVTHNVAYREVPFLVPAKLLHTENVELNDHTWEHLNTWGFPYNMRCDKVQSEHLWFKCEGRWCRAVKAEFAFLRCEGFAGQWKMIGNMLWGFPCMLTGNPEKFYNVLAEPEKYFKTKKELEKDWQAFKVTPNPDYTEFCNDIFGDG